MYDVSMSISQVLATSGNASFVETEMVTGRKHQIRLHLGLGLGTPILGDNKYSYSDKVEINIATTEHVASKPCGSTLPLETLP